MSRLLSFHECRRVFELLGYYPDFEDPDVYVRAVGVQGPKAVVAAVEALDDVDPDALVRWLATYHGMSVEGVGNAVNVVLRERP